jgi:hypothetical protein
VILEEQTDDEYFASVVKELRADVEGGLLLSQALGRHPKIFSRLYVSMVEAGEAAGILDQVLDRVAFQIEKDTQIRRRVKGAMMYPMMVMIFATLVLTGTADVPRAGLREHLRAARRQVADADAVCRERVKRPASRLVHHLSAGRLRSGVAASSAPSRAGSSGTGSS